MNLTEAVRKIKAISYALNQLEVKGRTNLDILLGSIQSLDNVAAQIEAGLREMEPPTSAPEIKLELAPENEEKPAE